MLLLAPVITNLLKIVGLFVNGTCCSIKIRSGKNISKLYTIEKSNSNK